MNEFEVFSIGFGNDKGQTVTTLLQQQRKKIELANIKVTQLQHPKIQIRKLNIISLGPLQECIRKKKDRGILMDLLRVNADCDANQIEEKCKAFQAKVANDLSLINALMEDNRTDKFIQATKATGKQAQKYLAKYGTVEKAVPEYQRHQQIIKKFMQQNKCDRENAIIFLESNNYEMF